PSLPVPDTAGGVGMKMIAVATLAEEIGRAALPSPLLSTMIATTVLRAAGATAWLERVAAGEAASLAITKAAGSWEPEDTDGPATSESGRTVLTGRAAFVQDARKVAFFVVSARGPAGVGLYAVRADAPGVMIAPDRIVDLTRDQARSE